jgi:hypothetical protein
MFANRYFLESAAWIQCSAYLLNSLIPHFSAANTGLSLTELDGVFAIEATTLLAFLKF